MGMESLARPCIWNSKMKWPDDFIKQVGIDPYYKDEHGVIYCGDCLRILPKMPEKFFNHVITDPPYGIGKDEWDKQYPSGNFHKLYRVAKTVSIMPGQWALQECIDEMGASYKGMIAAFNKNGMTYSPLGFGNWIPVLIAGEKPKQGPDAFTFVIKDRKNSHASPKPIEFMLKLTQRLTESKDLICDPFLGSGTTAVAAKQLGRRYVGIDTVQKYCDIAIDRLRQRELAL